MTILKGTVYNMVGYNKKIIRGDFIMLKREMLGKKVWGVAGVTDDTDRYGYKIWKILKEHGYKAHGINPRIKELEGEQIFKSVKAVPEFMDVLSMVVGPEIALKTLDEAKEKGIEYIFFQPGSYNDEVIAKAEELGFKYLVDDCIYATLAEK